MLLDEHKRSGRLLPFSISYYTCVLSDKLVAKLPPFCQHLFQLAELNPCERCVSAAARVERLEVPQRASFET